jgi:hypothetical protein
VTTSESALPGRPFPLRYPEWQLEYQDVLLETDSEQLAERVADAETAIFNRLQQLSESQDSQGERQAIQDAIRALRVIERDRLGFPDWDSDSRSS